ncbi:MAG: hypothetical protein M1826_003227 [Phylliscum demangeonii]|nr:MAG: hypothetical protein M1826_003227 [Phylliscum demangeonii]
MSSAPSSSVDVAEPRPLLVPISAGAAAGAAAPFHARGPGSPGSRGWWKVGWSAKTADVHRRVPVLRKLPRRVIGIILLIAAVNGVVWIAAGIVLAIDLMTRRLIASGQRPVTVGMFFSLGHSTESHDLISPSLVLSSIVVTTSIVVAATAAAISTKFDRFSRIGSIIGTSVSAGFLILLGLMNLYILRKLLQQMARALAGGAPEHGAAADGRADENPPLVQFYGGGPLMQLCKKMFRLIDKPWKMYPLGILFGLGFDTSSEVALLGISSIQAAQGTSIWLILLFPVLFTAGMCLLDTSDGALMMTLYASTRLAPDPIAILYYSIVLTAITILVALFIGLVQLLTLVLNVAHPAGAFWDGVAAIGDHFDVVGAAICASFVGLGALSVLLYRPWRTRVDGRRAPVARVPELEVEGVVVVVHDDDDDEGAVQRPSRSSHVPDGILV